MYILLRVFVDILLFRAGPQAVPASVFLLQSAIVFYFMVRVLVALLTFSPLSAVGVSVMDTVLLTSLVWVSLWSRDLNNRVLQTLTAALGTLGLLTLIVLPLDILYIMTDSDEGVDALFSIIMLVLTAWSLTVLGYILRNALDIGAALAVGLSMLYFFVSFVLTVLLFTVPVSE